MWRGFQPSIGQQIVKIPGIVSIFSWSPAGLRLGSLYFAAFRARSGLQPGTGQHIIAVAAWPAGLQPCSVWISHSLHSVSVWNFDALR